MDQHHSRWQKNPPLPPRVIEIGEEEMPVFDDELEARIRQAASKAIASDTFEVPRLPDMALEVMRLADSPAASAERIAELVQRDPFLAGRLLKAVNAVGNAAVGRKIVSVPEAVSRLGIRETHNIVLAASMQQTIYRGRHKDLLEQLWRQSVGCAAGCELIAQAAGKGGGKAFIVGLIHDIGRPMLVKIVEDLLEGECAGRVEFERAWAVVNDLAPQLSQLVLARWELPPSVSAAVGKLHQKQTGPVSTTHATLQLAQWLTRLDRDEVEEDAAFMAMMSLPATRALKLSDQGARQAFDGFPERWARMLGERAPEPDTAATPRPEPATTAATRPAARPSEARAPATARPGMSKALAIGLVIGGLVLVIGVVLLTRGG